VYSMFVWWAMPPRYGYAGPINAIFMSSVATNRALDPAELPTDNRLHYPFEK